MKRANKNGPRKVKYYRPKRRAIYAAGEQIVHLEVFERDGWICGICKEPVDKNLRKPDPKCATLDHVVPISVAVAEGWEIHLIHTHANVQCSHQDCNLDKGNNRVVESDTIDLTER